MGDGVWAQRNPFLAIPSLKIALFCVICNLLTEISRWTSKFFMSRLLSSPATAVNFFSTFCVCYS